MFLKIPVQNVRINLFCLIKDASLRPYLYFLQEVFYFTDLKQGVSKATFAKDHAEFVKALQYAKLVLKGTLIRMGYVFRAHKIV